MKEVNGKVYDRSDFFWAVMYGKKQITCIYPRYSEARQEAFRLNARWEERGWRRKWGTKRFMFRFHGAEIDAFEHEWWRQDKGTDVIKVNNFIKA